MKISILCSSENHPINPWLIDWVEKNINKHEVHLFRSKKELIGGDLLFLISCNEIVSAKDREGYEKVLVIHASDLPKGRGWSPHVWSVIKGDKEIVVTLLEADDRVDCGDIWKKERLSITPDLLYEEINQLLFDTEIKLMTFAVENFGSIVPEQQSSQVESSYYPIRTPDDSEIDPNKSIAEQFNLMRVCDFKRFPAYFKLHGHTYTIKLEKMVDEK